MRRYVFLVAAVVLTMSLVAGCESGSGTSGDAGAEAGLTDVDVDVLPAGPNVGELIAVQDVEEILGRDDIVLTPAN